jgi:hypothetical protein
MRITRSPFVALRQFLENISRWVEPGDGYTDTGCAALLEFQNASGVQRIQRAG